MARNYLEELYSLDGRLALVTGASGGIGSELAFALAMAGARVALAGRSVERLERARTRIEAEGGSAKVFVADVERTDAVAPLVRKIGDDLGSIDILVNCAGINRRQ